MLRALLATLAIVVSCLGLNTGIALAAEPDNDITRATPVTGGTDYVGALETTNDTDWYSFDVYPQKQFKISLTGAGGCGSGDHAGFSSSLWDNNGQEINGSSTGDVAYTYTSPPGSPSRYYLQIYPPCRSDSVPQANYQFRIDPVEAIGPAAQSPPERMVIEPNDTVDTATGPVVGATIYRGSLETLNDQDMFVFYTPSQPKQVDVTVAVANVGSCWLGGLGFKLTGSDYLDTIGVNADRVGHFHLSSRGAGRYYLSTSGCEGAEYTVRVDPPEAVTSTPPVPFWTAGPRSSRCQVAHRQVRDLRSRVRTLRHKWRATHKRRYRRQLAAAEWQLFLASQRVKTYC